MLCVYYRQTIRLNRMYQCSKSKEVRMYLTISKVWPSASIGIMLLATGAEEDQTELYCYTLLNNLTTDENKSLYSVAY